MPYVATINTPGYVPEDDGQPPIFEAASEAWAYLRDERERHENDAFEEGDEESYSDTFYALSRHARHSANEPSWTGAQGTIYGDTPGYDGRHDLGKAYTVDWTDEAVPQ